MATLYLVRHGEAKDNVVCRDFIRSILSAVHFNVTVFNDLKRAYDSAQILVRQKEISVEKPFPLADKVLVSIFKTIM